MRFPPAGSPRVPAQGSSAQGEPAPKARARAVADGNQVKIPGPAGGDGAEPSYPLIGFGGAAGGVQETAPATWTVPETDTGGLVEHTQASERTASKELGKLPA